MSYYPQKMQDWAENPIRFASGSARAFQYSVTNTALSPDGLPNYGLRTVPQYIAGVNTPDFIIDINDTRTAGPRTSRRAFCLPITPTAG